MEAIGDYAAGGDDLLAHLERRRHADRLERGGDAAIAGHRQYLRDRRTIGTVNHGGRAEALGDLQATVVAIETKAIRICAAIETRSEAIQTRPLLGANLE
ncbi:hypothetical protein U1707_05075 [Sphingomonas sp. PB2P12]